MFIVTEYAALSLNSSRIQSKDPVRNKPPRPDGPQGGGGYPDIFTHT